MNNDNIKTIYMTDSVEEDAEKMLEEMRKQLYPEKSDKKAPSSRGKKKSEVGLPDAGYGGDKGQMRGTAELTPLENANYINQTMELIELEDVNFNSYVNVRNRTKLYFKMCAERGLRPVLPGLQLALGIDDETWRQWLDGKRGSASVRKAFKEADTMLQHQTAMWTVSGRIAPVAGIFELKSYHGRTEDQKYDNKPADALGKAKTREELEKKYEGLELTKSTETIEIGVDDYEITTPSKAEGEEDFDPPQDE